MGFLGIGNIAAPSRNNDMVFENLVEKQLNETVTVWATKASKDAKVGIGFNQDGPDCFVIGWVSDKGLLKHSALQKGMEVIAINGNACPSNCREAIELIREADGSFSIEAKLKSPHQLTAKATKVLSSDFLGLKFKKIVVDSKSDPIIIVSAIEPDSPFVGSGVRPGMQLLFVRNPQKSSMVQAKSTTQIENYLRDSTGTIEVCVAANYIYLGPWMLNSPWTHAPSYKGEKKTSPLSESGKSAHTVSTHPADTTHRDDSEAGESFGMITPASSPETKKKKKVKSESKKDAVEEAPEKPQSTKKKTKSKASDHVDKSKSFKEKKSKKTDAEKPKKSKSEKDLSDGKEPKSKMPKKSKSEKDLKAANESKPKSSTKKSKSEKHLSGAKESKPKSSTKKSTSKKDLVEGIELFEKQKGTKKSKSEKDLVEGKESSEKPTVAKKRKSRKEVNKAEDGVEKPKTSKTIKKEKSKKKVEELSAQ